MKHPNIKVIQGKKPILLSAPHAVKIKINKKKKGEEFKPHEIKVAKIVNELCAKTDAWGVFTQKSPGIKHLENWEEELYHIYKSKINNLIATKDIGLFLDIHGSGWDRPFHVDYDFLVPNLHPHDDLIEKMLAEIVQESMPDIKISSGFFRNLNGPGKNTLTRHVRKRFFIPAIQIEINKQIRTNKEEYSSFLKALHKFIKEYENTFIGLQ